MRVTTITLGLALCLSFGAANAETVVTADSKMALYTFDKDEAGKSNCTEDCAVNWPPYLGNEGEDLGEGWALINREDGTLQWAYEGKPVYTFIGDKAAGEVTGDGKGDVWHVLTK